MTQPDQKSVEALVIERLTDVLDQVGKKTENLDASTRLVGGKAVLDSLNLVTLIADLEQDLEERFGMVVTIADERAMSREKSPFRSVESLSAYICEIARNGNS